jgi:hypothetical protein
MVPANARCRSFESNCRLDVCKNERFAAELRNCALSGTALSNVKSSELALPLLLLQNNFFFVVIRSEAAVD